MLVLNQNYEIGVMNQKATWLNQGGLNLQVGLYTNNYTPVRNSTLANFTEASFPGYARISLSAGWGSAYLNNNNFVEIDYRNLLVYTPSSVTAGQQVYGYFIWSLTLSQIFWAELNPAGPTLVGASLLPFILQLNLQESQWNPSSP